MKWMALVCVAALFSSCMTTRITRRYRTQTQTTLPPGQIEASLGAFAMPAPRATAVRTALTSLGDRGQASLVRELGRKSNDTAALLAAIERQAADSDLDHTTWTRRVVFSIENRSAGLADRISTARIRLIDLTPPSIFQSWTEFATKYDSVDLGTLRMTQHRELAGTAGNLASAGSATARQSQDREETVKLSERYVSLTGALSSASAELIQQGAPGMDLTGNVAVDLTIRVPNAKQSDVFRFANDQVTRHTIQYSASPRDITVQAILNATIRKVLSGESTLIESDDKVEFRTGPTQPIQITLVPAEEQVVHVWILRHSSGSVLHFARPAQIPELIQFGDYETAIAFRASLAKSLSVPGQILVLPPSSMPLNAAQAAALNVEIVTLNPSR